MTTLFIPIGAVHTFFGALIIRISSGDLLAIDISDPTHPSLATCFSITEEPLTAATSTWEEWPWPATEPPISPARPFMGIKHQNGVGRLRIVDVSDPTNLSEVGDLDVPGTVGLSDVVVHGEPRARHRQHGRLAKSFRLHSTNSG